MLNRISRSQIIGCAEPRLRSSSSASITNRDESTLDRLLRRMIGATVAFGSFNTIGTLSFLLAAPSVVMVVTAVVVFCRLYRILTLST